MTSCISRLVLPFTAAPFEKLTAVPLASPSLDARSETFSCALCKKVIRQWVSFRHRFVYGDVEKSCKVDWSHSPAYSIVFVAFTVWAPLAVMAYCYALILKVRRRLRVVPFSKVALGSTI